MKWRDDKFGALFVMEKDPETWKRIASFYCSDEMAARPEIQELMATADL